MKSSIYVHIAWSFDYHFQREELNFHFYNEKDAPRLGESSYLILLNENDRENKKRGISIVIGEYNHPTYTLDLTKKEYRVFLSKHGISEDEWPNPQTHYWVSWYYLWRKYEKQCTRSIK